MKQSALLNHPGFQKSVQDQIQKKLSRSQKHTAAVQQGHQHQVPFSSSRSRSMKIFQARLVFRPQPALGQRDGSASDAAVLIRKLQDRCKVLEREAAQLDAAIDADVQCVEAQLGIQSLV
jgi:hypothetical protein